jgi:hypothetical protein
MGQRFFCFWRLRFPKLGVHSSIILFTVFFLYQKVSLSQVTFSNFRADVCDTFSLNGFLVMSSKKCFITGKFITYFGFINKDDIVNSKNFIKLLSYQTDTSFYINRNLSNREFKFLKRIIKYPVYYTPGTSGISRYMKNQRCGDTVTSSFISETAHKNSLNLPHIEWYAIDERILNIKRPFCVISSTKYLFTLIQSPSYHEYKSYFNFSKRYRTRPYMLARHYKTKLARIGRQDRKRPYSVLLPIKKLVP